MKVRVKLFRAVEIPTDMAKGALGLPADALADKCKWALKEQFGPLAPRVQVFWPDAAGLKTIAGVEMIAFDVPRAGVPSSGIVLGDPIDSKEISEAEGALKSELSRYGIFIEPEQSFEWRLHYELEGN